MEADCDACVLGQQVGPAGCCLVQFGDGLAVLGFGERTQARVAVRGAGDPGDRDAVWFYPCHRPIIERTFDERKFAGPETLLSVRAQILGLAPLDGTQGRATRRRRPPRRGRLRLWGLM